MEVRYELRDGCLKVQVPKELDHCSASQLREETDLLIDSYGVSQLTFDFMNTEFMDSSGIGVLIGRSKKMKYHGGGVVATNLSQRVRKIFMMSGLHRVIELPDKMDVEEGGALYE